MDVCFLAESVDFLGSRVDGDVLVLAVDEEVIVDDFDSRAADLGCGADFVVEEVAGILTQGETGDCEFVGCHFEFLVFFF